MLGRGYQERGARHYIGGLAGPCPTATVPRDGVEGEDMDDRAFASAIQLSNEIRERRIGCVELLDFYLARAERQNPD